MQQFTFCGRTVEVTQDTEAEIDVERNTGLRLWDGAYLLAKYLEVAEDFREGKFWQGKRCLELGCGCGLVGLVAWLLGAQVTLTDTEETLVHTAKCVQKNIDNWKASQLTVPSQKSLKLETLLWGADNPNASQENFDVVLGSDVIYQPETVPLLLKTLQNLTIPKTLVLIAYKERGLGEHVFFDSLPDYSLECARVDRTKYPDDFANSDYTILNIRKTMA